jgi:hypothetical protein
VYLVGAPHPNKDAARRLLEQSIAQGSQLELSLDRIERELKRLREMPVSKV